MSIVAEWCGGAIILTCFLVVLNQTTFFAVWSRFYGIAVETDIAVSVKAAELVYTTYDTVMNQWSDTTRITVNGVFDGHCGISSFTR